MSNETELPASFPYLLSEYKIQAEKMLALGIDTRTCTFEQAVNALLHLLTQDPDVWDDVRNTLKLTLHGRVAEDKMEDALDDLIYNFQNHYTIKRKNG